MAVSRALFPRVTREQAAKLIVEGRVTLSGETEVTNFFTKRLVDKRAFEKADMARRLQVTIVSAPEEIDHSAKGGHLRTRCQEVKLMALFTDAGIVTITDLLKYEGTLVQVASDHDINVGHENHACNQRHRRPADAVASEYRGLRSPVHEPPVAGPIDGGNH